MALLFRDAMKRLSYPTIILTSSAPLNSEPSKYHGLTISSMTSLSLNPKPLLQFNLQLPSHTSRALRMHNLFAVHFLRPDYKSIELAKRFSQGTRVGGTHPFLGLKKLKDYSLFLGSEEIELPLLKHAERILICKTKDAFVVQDHEIWVGEVIDSIINSPEEETVMGGLLHCNRRFYKLGDTVSGK
ncbi:flavin reductase family protein KNAG_0B01070 [Huiozyma naganishii CBS 8797]|uniref:Flavin reductase like domain-containing protein n=1 Tax=Huiozyma naganishii (strain ATCC MYA-139 / BCRC 22969 / CBS 8797 / KCTC 17520 / NBRC 10181 / NCYC 3082 / Yp74L-3) TaxID=1071383 RepID=J7S381_HUIN7|nr:hypothetical protein KNAG_0B01070 [Kazachstania naganishii CBS 8797]CCK68554.1 hypothetical protein KNAG_0B01070 [Kazachstania naganishii CBS 8797]